MGIFDKCGEFTEARAVMEMGYYPYFIPINSSDGTEVTINGKRLIMIGSNNYLGLTTHPQVIEAGIQAIKKYGVGCTGSRFLNGTYQLHEELENELADFMGKEAALVFSTGFQTNLGTISCIVGKDDLIIADKDNHASIVDGCRLSFGSVKRYKHNDMENLENILKSCNGSNNYNGKLIVCDGVFSINGDLANLPEIVALAKKYDARVMVDDAHGIGVLGKNGRGTAEYFELDDKIDIIMGTFSKSFASIGGFICSKQYVIHYIKHHSRALIFSASIPPASVAATRAALKIIRTEPERRERVLQNAEYMRKGLVELGFDINVSQSPVISINIGDRLKTFKVWK